MLFYGGIVPSYMLMKYLNLIDTIWAMIIPYLVVQFNLLVVKTFFEELPESVEESAKIDGASHFTILFRIVVPMSTPVIATVSLFSLVIYWNNFFHPLLFINTPSLKPLALYLYEMITSANDVLSRLSLSDQMSLAAEGVVSTTIMVTSLPIFALYPFVQRFLVQGLTLGSVKG
jgi:putative aldouronate transport system permease protein